MPKKIKTLKQKIRSDQRQSRSKAPDPVDQQGHDIEQNHMKIAFDFKAPTEKLKSVEHAIVLSEYKYLSKDLIKTALFTTAIVFIELLVRTYTNFGK